MLKEIKYPYKELSDLEIHDIEIFRFYHLASYNNIHVYYTTDLRVGAGYNIIVSLHEFKTSDDIKFDDVTKDITDIDNLLDNF
jgi:hypothetical protein